MIHFIDSRNGKFYLFDQHGATADILLTSELTQSEEGKALMADMGIDIRKVAGYEEQQCKLL